MTDVLSNIQDKISELPQALYEAIKKPFIAIYDKLIEIFKDYENYIYIALIVIGILFMMKMITQFMMIRSLSSSNTLMTNVNDMLQ